MIIGFKMTKNNRKHIVSIADLSKQEIIDIVDRGLAFATGREVSDRLLKDRIIGIYFRKTSTRTRTSFSSAALRMGAKIISYGPHDLQENTGESPADTVRVLSGMLDGFVARTAGSQEEMRTFAHQHRMSVINAMTKEEHPTQALADLTTMKQHFGALEGLRVLYLGEGNNTAASMALSIPMFSNTELFFYSPPGYGLDPKIKGLSQNIAMQNGSCIQEFHELNNLPDEVDVVYTTRWQTTGTTKQDSNWRDIFKPFTVSEDVKNKYINAIFMHDLPAHRGEEVDTSVIDGDDSIVFQQAENKLHSAKAVLEWCLEGIPKTNGRLISV